jgi:ABC-type glycerol-3-phosphate transport system permease component
MLSKAVRAFCTIAVFLFLFTAVLVFLAPLVINLARSLTPLADLHNETYALFPPGLTMRNYTDLLFTGFELPMLFPRYFMNSVLVTVLAVVLQLWLATPAAYALAKVDFPGVKLLNRLLEAGLLFGGAVLFVNQYTVLNGLRLINTFPALVLPLIVTASVPGVFLMRQFIKALPDTMLEEAKLSGASHARICRDIIIPNIRPARITAGILALTGAWYAGSGDFVYSERLRLLGDINLSGNPLNSGVSYALATIMLLFPLAAFLIYRKDVMNTMAYGGLK